MRLKKISRSHISAAAGVVEPAETWRHSRPTRPLRYGGVAASVDVADTPPRGGGECPMHSRLRKQDVMNCSHCEELMSDYLEGTLQQPDQNAMVSHLNSCA